MGRITHLVRALIGLVTFALVACSGGSPSINTITRAEYLYDFATLNEMVATSTAVVEGSVVGVEPGAVAAVEDEAEIRYMDVTLKLDRVFLGPGINAGDTITIEELPNVDLSLTPNRSQGFFFLSWDKDTSSYLIINPEGRFLVDGSGSIISSETDPDDWVLAIEKETPQQFTRDIVSAVDSVTRGSATATPVA